jgi:hypothetical protein
MSFNLKGDTITAYFIEYSHCFETFISKYSYDLSSIEYLKIKWEKCSYMLVEINPKMTIMLTKINNSLPLFGGTFGMKNPDPFTLFTTHEQKTLPDREATLRSRLLNDSNAPEKEPTENCESATKKARK